MFSDESIEKMIKKLAEEQGLDVKNLTVIKLEVAPEEYESDDTPCNCIRCRSEKFFGEGVKPADVTRSIIHDLKSGAKLSAEYEQFIDDFVEYLAEESKGLSNDS